MRYGTHIGFIACMKQLYDIFGIYVGLIHYMNSRVLCALHKGSVRRRNKHEPTGSYLYLARQLSKCMMKSYAFDLHIYPVRTEMNCMQ